MRFQDKVVVVTGASSGIGAAIALSFAKEGADVVIVARNNENLKVTEAKCAEVGKTPLKLLADVSKDEQAKAIIDQTIEKYGKIDILINNAGILRFGNITDGTLLSAYDETMRTNLRSIIHLTTLATPHLIKTKGNIINISSSGAKVSHPSFLSYGLSKLALNLFGEGAALELAEHGVRVNTISPGPVTTDIWKNTNVPVESLKGMKFKIPLNKMSKPEEIANLALFLADDKVLAISGSNCAALELAEHGVRVNTISPGPVITDIWKNANFSLESVKGLDFKIPLNKILKPEEIATLALFLADDKIYTNSHRMGFQNKVVIVTGASSGIGAAIALSFAKEGADVVIVARNNEKLKITEAQCEGVGKKPLKILADISKEDQAKSIIDQTIDKYGKIDILINNAGILRFGSITDGTILSVYDEIFSTNLRPIIHLTTLAAPYLIETKGNIINISSEAALKVKHPKFLSYSMSKSALNLFSQGAALELAEHGVRVNTISPGPVITDILENSNLPADSMKGLELKIPLKRISNPEEIATVALFLADDKALGITGSNYLVDNGTSLT
ncbi:uncharacterized protein LOC112052808 [Bicyclus anynana]|uniref:Uncharacterized protein LOC112052808 n=1 Tax=Bicyclus anynana TaxID=110368 RepID=A0A6J1NSG1_BICAN|nr:uncharacterized protein LOC112052808 [Bicyclus anynana]